MPTAVVLAGGLGTRLRSAVPDLPKPMAPIDSRPFLEHLLDHWICQGIDRFILAVGYRRDAIMRHFGSRYQDMPIEYAIEETPRGTGGALTDLADRLPADERFVLLNGDTYFDVQLDPLMDAAHRRDADWYFSLFSAAEPGRFMGLKLDSDGRICALRHDDQKVGRMANGGVYVVHPRSLRHGLRRAPGAVSLENDLFPHWLRSGQRFFGLPFPGAFIDIGVPHDYHRASNVISSANPRPAPAAGIGRARAPATQH